MTVRELDPRAEALVIQMFAMLRDLEEGYPWRELGISLEEVKEQCLSFGIPESYLEEQ